MASRDLGKRLTLDRVLLVCAWFGSIGLLPSIDPALASAALASAEDVLGEWRTPSAMQVQIKVCGNDVCGRVVRVPDPSVPDLHNPEPRLRMRPVLGIQIFSSVRRAGSNGWKGHIYVPESGNTYVSRINTVDRGQLQVSYCGPLGFFCTREIWTRTR